MYRCFMSVTFGRERNCIENTHTHTFSVWKEMEKRQTGHGQSRCWWGEAEQTEHGQADRQTDRLRPGSKPIRSPVGRGEWWLVLCV